MIRCRYKGKEVQNTIAGPVKKGTIVRFSEEVVYCLRSDPDWEVLRDKPNGNIPENLFPAKGPHYDLTQLPWKNQRIFNEVRKLRRPMLVKALTQMESQGLPVPPITDSSGISELQETLLEMGRKADWI